ncbi:MAG: hypothetical protein FWF09_00995 [Bacteroidales bacterium]|nr:hypothetical protein [Bacteroidales bacterium]
MKKYLIFSFIWGILFVNGFSQQPNYLTLPVSQNVEYRPSISFFHESNSILDTLIALPKPDAITGGFTYIHPVLTLTGSNVGIGTTLPKQRLHVNGNGLLSGQLAVGTTTTNFQSYHALKLLLGNHWTFFDLTRAKILGYNCHFWEQDEQAGRIDRTRASSAMMMNQDGSINICTAPASSSPIAWNYFTMSNNGYVGIGTRSPSERFQIGNIWTFHDGETKYIGRNVTYTSLGDARIEQGFASMIRFDDSGSITLGTAGSDIAGSLVDIARKNITLAANGNVGIGTTNTQTYKLAVKGIIGAEKIILENTGNWPDYVFEPDYNLMSIGELEEFINENKHLPNIPNKEDISNIGQDVGEINRLLLEKIEELTLYIIQQQKEIDELKRR